MAPWWGAVWPDTTNGPYKGKFMHLVKEDDWNHYYIKVVNGKVSVALNGVPTVEFESERAKREGYLGIGLHHGKGTRVEVKNYVVRPLTQKQE
jgi:hypothetical protein